MPSHDQHTQPVYRAERLMAMDRRSAIVSLGLASSWLVSGCASVPRAVPDGRRLTYRARVKLSSLDARADPSDDS